MKSLNNENYYKLFLKKILFATVRNNKTYPWKEEGKEIKLSVNAIAPFIIDTPANRDWTKDRDYQSWMKPEEIGELIHLIFSNYNFINGNIIELKERFSL